MSKKRYPSIAAICIHCDVPFLVEAEKLRDGRKSFCCHSHYVENKRGNPPIAYDESSVTLISVNCLVCNEPFSVPKGQERRNGRMFCSLYCYDTRGEKTPEDLFWYRVDVCAHGRSCRTCCWFWMGGRSGTNQKYGMFHHFINGKRINTSAHRVSYSLHFGDIPKNMLVCHICDEPLCIQPGHFFLGTHADNSQDASKKKRLIHGEAHHSNKVPSNKIPEMRELRRKGWTYKQLGEKFGINLSTARRICIGEKWKHIK